MAKPIIEVQKLSKRYQLGTFGARSLREEAEAFWDRLSRPRSRNGMTNASERTAASEFWALRDVSFDVQQGEVLGVVGRNGAGKSTLLKILSRITEPTSGEVIMRGRVASLLEVGTGFHPELSGRENVFLNGAILGMKKAEIARKFDEIVDFAEVGKFIDTPVKRYSSGMYVRLAFGVAAHLEPEILVVDEVLAVGDFAFQQKCLGKMDEVARKDGRTVLFVSHNMAALRSLCTRGVLLHQGSVVMMGDAQEVVTRHMADGVVAEGAISWPPPKAPQNFSFLRAYLSDEGGDISPIVRHDQSFYLNIEYKVEERLSDLRIGFILQTKDGVTLCGSNDEADHSEVRAKGQYVSCCRFPAYVFNEGNYQVQFGAETADGGLHMRTPFCLSFAVRDLEKHGVSKVPLPGVIRPRLQWTVQLSDSSNSPQAP